MMNFLIIGENSFLGKDLFYLLKKDGFSPTFLKGKVNKDSILPEGYDVLINCASKICRKGKSQTLDILKENEEIAKCVVSNGNKFKKIFCFGSGAEYNRDKDVNPLTIKDGEEPNDFYGISKTESRLKILKMKNSYWLRIFGCFGINEPEDRFIKNCILKGFKNEDIIIPGDRLMSFTSTFDIKRVILFACDSSSRIRKEIDLSLLTNKLSNIAIDLISKMGSKSKILINGEKQKDYYTNGFNMGDYYKDLHKVIEEYGNLSNI